MQTHKLRTKTYTLKKLEQQKRGKKVWWWQWVLVEVDDGCNGYGGGSGWKAKCVVVLEKMAHKETIGTNKKGRA